MKKTKTINIVAPVFNEEGNISHFVERIHKLRANIAKEFAINLTIINDGSTDNSLPLLLDLVQSHKWMRVINFSRNFGHQVAITAGIEHSDADAVVTIDTDLQDPPEIILELIESWKSGNKIVNARRSSRKDSFFKKITASLFYKILNQIAERSIPENVGDFRLIDKQIVDILKKMPEKERYIRGITNWVGFRQSFVDYDRDARFSGETKYTLSKMFGLAKNAIFAFTNIPRKIAFWLSWIYFFLSVCFALYAVVMWYLDLNVPGWTSQIMIMLIFSSINFFILGIVLEYVARIYEQVRHRPHYIISEIFNKD